MTTEPLPRRKARVGVASRRKRHLGVARREDYRPRVPIPSGPLARLPTCGVDEATSVYGIDVYWLPLGAGGWFVRLNGLIYECVVARQEHRRPLDLYHSALEVRLPEGRFVIEDAWPIPDAEGDSRGVVVEGPVWTRGLARLRTFRYEVRRWRDGRIPDVAYAVASPQHVSDNVQQARRLLELAPSLPPLRWGRDETGIGDMWNSNSVISWLLAKSGVAAQLIQPPRGGRAPGWRAGLAVAGQPATVTAAPPVVS